MPNEEKIREIIREELAGLIKSDRYTFHKLIQTLDGRNIQTGKTNGTKFPQANDQLWGMWGATPVNQPEAVADPNDVSASYVQAEVQDIVDKVKLTLDRLQEIGLIKT